MRRARTRTRTTWTALAGVLASCATVLVATAAPAVADEVVERPADGVFAVEGRGYGHGRGLSQWGAQGAATQGVSAETIVSTYYPGTARAVLPAAPVRVLLSGDEGRDTVVVPATGLAVTDESTGTRQVLPSGPSRWRVVVDAAGLHLQGLTGSTWSAQPIGGGTTHGGPLRFSGPTFVRVVYASGASRDYRGAVQAVKTSASALQSVVVLSLEDYLLGVVPREAPSSWQPAALQAQAIAARSYSANKRARVAGGGTLRHLRHHRVPGLRRQRGLHRDGTRTDLEPASTTEAVRATAGVVRTSRARRSSRSSPAATAAGRRRGTSPTSSPVATTGTAPSPTRCTRGRRRCRPAPSRRSTRRSAAAAAAGHRARRQRRVGRSRADRRPGGLGRQRPTTGEAVRLARSWPGAADGLQVQLVAHRPEPRPVAAPSSRVGRPDLVKPPGDVDRRATATWRTPARPPGRPTGCTSPSPRRPASPTRWSAARPGPASSSATPPAPARRPSPPASAPTSPSPSTPRPCSPACTAGPTGCASATARSSARRSPGGSPSRPPS